LDGSGQRARLIRFGDQLDYRAGAQNRSGGPLKSAAETLADPSTGLWRCSEHQPLLGARPGAKLLEPDPVGGFIDRDRELRLHARPELFELGAHDSVICSPREK
jgi:hypothetical protein